MAISPLATPTAKTTNGSSASSANGYAEEGLKLLERMAFRDGIPDIIPCTSLIRGFCCASRTEKAARVLDFVEYFGASLDVITFNLIVSGYCKSGEPEFALCLLCRMSVPSDVVIYNTIFQCFYERRKLDKALELLDEMFQRDCATNVSKRLCSRCLRLHYTDRSDVPDFAVVGHGSEPESCGGLLEVSDGQWCDRRYKKIALLRLASLRRSRIIFLSLLITGARSSSRSNSDGRSD